MIDVGGSPDYFQIFETEILNKPRIKLKSSSAFFVARRVVYARVIIRAYMPR